MQAIWWKCMQANEYIGRAMLRARFAVAGASDGGGGGGGDGDDGGGGVIVLSSLRERIVVYLFFVLFRIMQFVRSFGRSMLVLWLIIYFCYTINVYKYKVEMSAR